MDQLELLEYLPEDLFDGTVVFITGGGSGINLGIARAFASLGADLAICGRSAERLESAAEELEGLGTLLVVDGGQNFAGSCPFGDLLDEAMKRDH